MMMMLMLLLVVVVVVVVVVGVHVDVVAGSIDMTAQYNNGKERKAIEID